MLRYSIPLVAKSSFNEYAIISSPDALGQAIHFTGQRLTKRLITDNTNTSICFSESAKQVSPSLFEAVVLVQPDDCISSILSSSSPKNCPTGGFSRSTIKLYSCDYDRAVLYKPTNEKVEVECNGVFSPLVETTTWIEFPNCSIHTRKQTFRSEQHLLKVLAQTMPSLSDRVEISTFQVEIKPDEHDPQVEVLKQQIEDELANLDQWFSHPWDYCQAIIIILSIVLVIGITTHFTIRRKQQYLLNRTTETVAGERSSSPVKPKTWAEEIEMAALRSASTTDQ